MAHEHRHLHRHARQRCRHRRQRNHDLTRYSTIIIIIFILNDCFLFFFKKSIGSSSSSPTSQSILQQTTSSKPSLTPTSNNSSANSTSKIDSGDDVSDDDHDDDLDDDERRFLREVIRLFSCVVIVLMFIFLFFSNSKSGSRSSSLSMCARSSHATRKLIWSNFDFVLFPRFNESGVLKNSRKRRKLSIWVRYNNCGDEYIVISKKLIKLMYIKRIFFKKERIIFSFFCPHFTVQIEAPSVGRKTPTSQQQTNERI